MKVNGNTPCRVVRLGKPLLLPSLLSRQCRFQLHQIIQTKPSMATLANGSAATSIAASLIVDGSDVGRPVWWKLPTSIELAPPTTGSSSTASDSRMRLPLFQGSARGNFPVIFLNSSVIMDFIFYGDAWDHSNGANPGPAIGG